MAYGENECFGRVDGKSQYANDECHGAVVASIVGGVAVSRARSQAMMALNAPDFLR